MAPKNLPPQKMAIRKTRKFDLQVRLRPYHDHLVIDLLNQIENDRLKVFDGNYFHALDKIMSGDTISLKSCATKEISIRRWFSLGCQVIRWDIRDEIDKTGRPEEVKACYTTNLPQVMFPLGVSHFPVGPTAFMGEIWVNRDQFQLHDTEEAKNRLRFVLAHEFTHVIDALRFLVPALRNWPGFWRNFLQQGEQCENANRLLRYHSVFVDNYGSENELSAIERYWPPKAAVWFKAFRKSDMTY